MYRGGSSQRGETSHRWSAESRRGARRRPRRGPSPPEGKENLLDAVRSCVDSGTGSSLAARTAVPQDRRLALAPHRFGFLVAPPARTSIRSLLLRLGRAVLPPRHRDEPEPTANRPHPGI